ncbi:hypothetical protein A3735_16945 [Oleiphilus sp. HI0061]|nr:hypothetical protein A3735_16945 [Oleiphilus sp. HI0061]
MGLGGAPKSMTQLANRLKGDGKQVEVLYLKDSDAKTLLKSVDYHVVGLPLRYFNHSSRWYKWYEPHLILFQLLSWLLTVFVVAPYWYVKLRPDVVYLNSSVLTDWLFVSKLFRIRNIVHVREAISKGYFGIRNNLIRLLLSKFADHVIFLSKHNRECLGANIASKTSIISNYVKGGGCVIDPKERQYDAIYVGGEKSIKGIDLIKELLESDNQYRLCLLGYYSDEFVDKYNSEAINVLGAVEDSMPYIADSRCLLFPATTPHFPRPVIEALSCGCVPVMSDIDGYEEIITPGETGVVFRNNDFNHLVESLDTALSMCATDVIQSCIDRYRNKFSDANEDKIIRIILS